MTDIPRILLQPLGDPAAAVCEGDVCEVPSPAQPLGAADSEGSVPV